jgi:hypothetical protein
MSMCTCTCVDLKLAVHRVALPSVDARQRKILSIHRQDEAVLVAELQNLTDLLSDRILRRCRQGEDGDVWTQLEFWPAQLAEIVEI